MFRFSVAQEHSAHGDAEQFRQRALIFTILGLILYFPPLRGKRKMSTTVLSVDPFSQPVVTVTCQAAFRKIGQAFVMVLSPFDYPHGYCSAPARGSFSSCWNYITSILWPSQNPMPGPATQTLLVCQYYLIKCPLCAVGHRSSLQEMPSWWQPCQMLSRTLGNVS